MKLKRRHYLILEEMLRHPEGVTRAEMVERIQRDGETGYNRKMFENRVWGCSLSGAPLFLSPPEATHSVRHYAHSLIGHINRVSCSGGL